MGGVSADFAKFKDWTSKKWMARAWQDKLAAGFTVSASWGGDKQNTLYQLLTLAQQHGMVWVGLGLAPGNNHSKGSPDDLNRTGASLGVMAQANADQGNEGIGQSEFAHRAGARQARRRGGAALADRAARAGGLTSHLPRHTGEAGRGRAAAAAHRSGMHARSFPHLYPPP